MKKTMKRITIILIVLSVTSLLLNFYLKTDLFLILSITFCTALYHFVMRLFVGEICNKFIGPKLNYNSKWFSEKNFEKKLYKLLKVKKWKKFAPTYSPESFSLKDNVIDSEAFRISLNISYEKDLKYPSDYVVVLIKKDSLLYVVKSFEN